MANEVICPKPYRIFLPADPLDPKSATSDLLDALFPKQSDPAPIFFSGSPPSRSDNPMVNDARFGEAVPLGSVGGGSGSGSGFGSGSVRNVGTRIRYGLSPAAIRVEGFDCRDHERSKAIQAVA